MESLMVVFLAVTVYGGYVFPVFGFVMSLREWLRLKSTLAPASWRRKASIVGFTLLTLCLLLWIYAATQELRGAYSYVLRSAQIGRWSALAILAISLFAESKLRRCLLIGALGLFFFFAITIGELP